MKRTHVPGCFAGALLGLVAGCHSEPESTVAESGSVQGEERGLPAEPAPLRAPETPPASAPAAPAPAEPEPVASEPPEQETEDSFAESAFPPTLSDTSWHADPWARNDCLRCHETGVGDAPAVAHAGMAAVLLEAACRSCHVQIPGSAPRERSEAVTSAGEDFDADAFPPMIPASSSHTNTWGKDDCLLCHENGIKNAPKFTHAGLPPVLRTAKCRTCHVQVRALDAAQDGP